MEPLEKRPALSLYWKCQILGWSAAALYWILASLDSPEFLWYLAVFYFIGDLLIYIPLTHLFRNFSIKLGWHKLNPQQLLLRIIPSVILLGAGYLVLTWTKNYTMRFWFEPGFDGYFLKGFEEHWMGIMMAGLRLMAIWVLAYYGYHYAQREINAIKENSRLAIVAREARFNNLASQLNPHFFLTH